MIVRAAALVLLLSVAACGSSQDAGAPNSNVVENALLPEVATPPEADRNAASSADSDAPLPTDAWVGKWTGVEGLALQIDEADAPGVYVLNVTLMDGENDYAGRADGNVIRFTRNGKEETIRAVSGAETGLKYLAGKKNCLMIASGEGFCRD